VKLKKAASESILKFMNSGNILETLQRHEAELRRHGVAHAGLFGSMARGDARPGSDIDIIIDLDPDAHISVFDYVDLKAYITGLFEGPVDVVNREGLKPYIRSVAQAEIIYAF
jgi:predicted nucleotidyltransferase